MNEEDLPYLSQKPTLCTFSILISLAMHGVQCADAQLSDGPRPALEEEKVRILARRNILVWRPEGGGERLYFTKILPRPAWETKRENCQDYRS